jgi:cyd operon protein YbgT
MWYFAWILGVTVAVLLASMSSSMYDAKEAIAATKPEHKSH